MQKKVYESYGTIRNFIKSNHLLQANIRLKEAPNGIHDVYIPITSLTCARTPKNDNKYNKMQIYFQTVDSFSGVIDDTDYQQFLVYMKRQTEANCGFANRQVIRNSQEVPMIDYVEGHFNTAAKMIRYSFMMNRHHYYMVKFYCHNDAEIIGLFSKEANSSWVTKLAMKHYKLSHTNLFNILKLLHYHLFNYPKGYGISGKKFNAVSFTNTLSVTYNLKKHQLTFSNISTSMVCDLRNVSIYMEITEKSHDPQITFEFKDHSKSNTIISLLLEPNMRTTPLTKLILNNP